MTDSPGSLVAAPGVAADGTASLVFTTLGLVAVCTPTPDDVIPRSRGSEYAAFLRPHGVHATSLLDNTEFEDKGTYAVVRNASFVQLRTVHRKSAV